MRKTLHSLILLAIVVLTTQSPDFAEARINPIMRYWSQQLPARLSVLSREGPAYRNCFLSPIQCNLPVQSVNPQLSRGQRSPANTDVVHLRRLLYPSQ
ncbi:unnamed protein product [Caenorhabditis auriculariae]|uniref:Uncharacterized protein n=1 Tax=Caenorhabditis auriculariae TaxID=2777116 RepID=A0A8S1H5I9_9PELO|nr:unnamed protein product [Caenorhabditis auriculariae]